MPGFPLRLDDFIDQMRDLPSADNHPKVMVPGEPELNARREQQEKGIRLHDSLVDNLNMLSEDLGLSRIHATSPSID